MYTFGQSLKITWWMMGGNIYGDADNLNVPLANTMTLYLYMAKSSSSGHRELNQAMTIGLPAIVCKVGLRRC
jgi:hypothetical protein